MRAYVCDICEKKIDNPYKMKMKEFFVGVSFYEYGCLPEEATRNKRIDLCGDCFEKLRNITIKKEKENG